MISATQMRPTRAFLGGPSHAIHVGRTRARAARFDPFSDFDQRLVQGHDVLSDAEGLIVLRIRALPKLLALTYQS